MRERREKMIGKYMGKVTIRNPVPTLAEKRRDIFVVAMRKGDFSHTSCFKNVIIPHGVTEIPARAFEENAFESIVFSDSMRIIGESAFRGCDLTSITICDNVLVIGTYEINEKDKVQYVIWNRYYEEEEAKKQRDPSKEYQMSIRINQGQ